MAHHTSAATVGSTMVAACASAGAAACPCAAVATSASAVRAASAATSVVASAAASSAGSAATPLAAARAATTSAKRSSSCSSTDLSCAATFGSARATALVFVLSGSAVTMGSATGSGGASSAGLASLTVTVPPFSSCTSSIAAGSRTAKGSATVCSQWPSSEPSSPRTLVVIVMVRWRGSESTALGLEMSEPGSRSVASSWPLLPSASCQKLAASASSATT
mmetsp:Transcript_11045/g.27631  ORF Transcript_11045/g.27631 Transcript_11045/m.27631 type:complete len:221 (-) Transcript_11045:519-1181(-)